MSQKGHTRDLRSKALWDMSYILTKERNLWGDPPVPFTATAVSCFAADKAARVLDLPCGDGRNLAELARSFPIVVGADSSKNALSIAKDLLAKVEIDNVELLEADLFDTRFADDSFDGIFCCDVLGHLTQPLDAINELLRICRPGKCIVANVFAMGDSTRGPNMVLIGNEEYVFDDRFYFKFYERAELDQLLSVVNASTVSVELVRWTEPPHEGYREYEHDHESWLFTLRKP